MGIQQHAFSIILQPLYLKQKKPWHGRLGGYNYSNFREIDLGRRYVVSLYFAIVTMATVGKGFHSLWRLCLGSSSYSFWKFSGIVVIALINGLYDSLKIVLLESPCVNFLWWCYIWLSIMIFPLMSDLTDDMLKESAKEVIEGYYIYFFVSCQWSL